MYLSDDMTEQELRDTAADQREQSAKRYGYYYWCNLSKHYIGVRADGTRGSFLHQFEAARFAGSHNAKVVQS